MSEQTVCMCLPEYVYVAFWAVVSPPSMPSAKTQLAQPAIISLFCTSKSCFIFYTDSGLIYIIVFCIRMKSMQIIENKFHFFGGQGGGRGG